MTEDTNNGPNNGPEQIALSPPPRANAPARRATLSPETPAGPAGAEGDRSNPRSDAGSSGRRQRQREAVRIPSVEELIVQLLQLNGAVLLGQITAQQANLMHRTITAAINALMRRSSGAQDHVKDTESLVDAIRRNPSLLNTFERFLSDDQLDGLMNELDGDDQQDRPPG